MPRTLNQQLRLFKVHYHIEGVEDGSKTFTASHIHEALAMCEIWLYGYTKEYYFIVAVECLNYSVDED